MDSFKIEDQKQEFYKTIGKAVQSVTTRKLDEITTDDYTIEVLKDDAYKWNFGRLAWYL